jgi:HNH endonuclease
MCQDCKNNEFNEIHLIDGDPNNNDFNNLMLLCYKCHDNKNSGSYLKHMYKTENGRAKVTVRLPYELMKKFKAAAINRDTRINNLVVQALKEFFEK